MQALGAPKADQGPAPEKHGLSGQRSIPSLDGLRAISVLFVVVAHLCGLPNSPLPHSAFAEGLGTFGVRVFFVISGYLITSILIAELDRTGTVSLKRFYFRRTLRLFPAAYVLVTVVAVLSMLGYMRLQKYDLVAAYTYTMNYYTDRSFALGHLWSLAVEEQFYLVWPFLLRSLGKLSGTRLLLGVLFVAPLLRLMTPQLGASLQFLIYADCLGTGCLLALAKDDLLAWPPYRRLFDSGAMTFLPIVALAAHYIPFTKVRFLLGETVMNVSMAAYLHWVIQNHSSRVGRFLNMRWLSAIGVLSYSVYLWQQMFTLQTDFPSLVVFPLNLVWIALASLASYFLIEAPSLRLRTHLETRFRGILAG